MKISDYTEADIPPELAKTVYGMMNVCNINIFMAFPKIQEDLWKFAHEHNKGTEWVNHHPLITLLVDKLTELNNGNQYHAAQAYTLVRQAIVKF